LEIAYLSDVGRARDHNEDNVLSFRHPDPGVRAARGDLFAVADGMGGHQAGEVASAMALQRLQGEYYTDQQIDIGTALVRAIKTANTAVHAAHEQPGKGGMGTTLVAAAVRGREVAIANVGDSRAYSIGPRRIDQITEDHSWVQEQVRHGLITEEQARKHPQRNIVTRSIGSKPTVEVDLLTGQLNDGDTLLLCSDGLTGVVQDNEIQTIVTNNSAQEAARRLIALANSRGGPDNITVLIVKAKAVKAQTQRAQPPKGGDQKRKR
jgi:serine/threonine protein phosphatase PrpC